MVFAFTFIAPDKIYLYLVLLPSFSVARFSICDNLSEWCIKSVISCFDKPVVFISSVISSSVHK